MKTVVERFIKLIPVAIATGYRCCPMLAMLHKISFILSAVPEAVVHHRVTLLATATLS